MMGRGWGRAQVGTTTGGQEAPVGKLRRAQHRPERPRAALRQEEPRLGWWERKGSAAAPGTPVPRQRGAHLVLRVIELKPTVLVIPSCFTLWF